MSKGRRFYPSAKMARAVADREAGQEDGGGGGGFHKMLDITTMARRMAKAVRGLVSLGWFSAGTVTAVENQMDRQVLHAQEGMFTALITFHALGLGPNCAGSVVLAAKKYGVDACMERTKKAHPRMKDEYNLRKKAAEVAGDIFIQAVTSQTDYNCPNRRFRDWLNRQVSEGRLDRAYDFWDAILLVMQYFLDNIRTKAYSDRDRLAISGTADANQQHPWVRDGITRADIIGIDPGFKHCALVAARLDLSALGSEGIPEFDPTWRPGQLARGATPFFAITGACMLDLYTPRSPKAMVVYLSEAPQGVPPPAPPEPKKTGMIVVDDDEDEDAPALPRADKKRSAAETVAPQPKRIKSNP